MVLDPGPDLPAAGTSVRNFGQELRSGTSVRNVGPVLPKAVGYNLAGEGMIPP
jgi:hypothetical protein